MMNCKTEFHETNCKAPIGKAGGGIFCPNNFIQAAKAFVPNKKFNFTPRLQLVRLEKREGALKGKNRAADLCTAKVLKLVIAIICNLSEYSASMIIFNSRL